MKSVIDRVPSLLRSSGSNPSACAADVTGCAHSCQAIDTTDRLEGDDPVSAGDECDDVRRSRPYPVQCGEVVVGCPPGNCTTLSNVYGDRSFNRFRDEVA